MGLWSLGECLNDCGDSWTYKMNSPSYSHGKTCQTGLLRLEALNDPLAQIPDENVQTFSYPIDRYLKTVPYTPLISQSISLRNRIHEYRRMHTGKFYIGVIIQVDWIPYRKWWFNLAKCLYLQNSTAPLISLSMHFHIHVPIRNLLV